MTYTQLSDLKSLRAFGKGILISFVKFVSLSHPFPPAYYVGVDN